MDFTREPIIETVITPKEGCKLVIRSSKSVGQEEYFVDAVEVVSFGSAIFFRSLERPKAFIVPASDYEVLEAREARIVLKNVGLDRAIKIGGGRESGSKQKEHLEEVAIVEKEVTPATQIITEPARSDNRADRKRDRRRQYRKKRNREENPVSQEDTLEPSKASLEENVELELPQKTPSEGELAEAVSMTGSLLSNLLSPPPLISETIGRYKEKFRDAFYTKEEQEARLVEEEADAASIASEVNLAQPSYGSFEMSEEDEEEIYRQRKRRIFFEEDEGLAESNEPELTSHEKEDSEKKELFAESAENAFSESTSLQIPEEVPTSTEITPINPPTPEGG
ncbi:MAG: hypothetical protein ACSNEK_07575 [Parachlamydiaceae bacterium]